MLEGREPPTQWNTSSFDLEQYLIIHPSTLVLGQKTTQWNGRTIVCVYSDVSICHLRRSVMSYHFFWVMFPHQSRPTPPKSFLRTLIIPFCVGFLPFFRCSHFLPYINSIIYFNSGFIVRPIFTCNRTEIMFHYCLLTALNLKYFLLFRLQSRFKFWLGFRGRHEYVRREPRGRKNVVIEDHGYVGL